jgi:hypothetical protein
MAFNHQNSAQAVWAILLMAMGVLLFVKTPYALRQGHGSGFLHFARYFIGVFLVLGGVRKLYALYFSKPKDSSREE